MITLANSTRVAVHILVEDDTGNVTALIMALTALVNILVKMGQWINGAMLLVIDFAEAARFTSTIFTIGFKSLAFGFVGVRL